MSTPKILIILPHNPGDVLMGLYLVSRIKTACPDTEIHYLSGSEPMCFVRNHPDITNTFELPSKTIKTAWQENRPGEILKIIHDFTSLLQEFEFDLSVNLFQENFGALIHSFVHSKKKLGYNFEGSINYQVRNRYMRHLFAVPIKRSQNPWHVVDIFLRALGLQSAERPALKLPPVPEFNFLKSEVLKKKFFVFQLGSAWKGKSWPIKSWAKLSSLLGGEADHILITGAPEEGRLWLEFQAALPNDYRKKAEEQIINLIGKTHLLQTYAVIQQAEWLITGDTVSMHLGAAAGVKTLALFGASNPVETGPYGNGNFVIRKCCDVGEKLPLSENNSGLESIQPDEVANFIQKGITPQTCKIWETCWNPDWKMQVLKSPKQELHPFQHNTPDLEKALQLRQSEDFPLHYLTLEADAVLQQLNKCFKKPGKKSLLKLESLDRVFAKKTREDIIWEAYRIQINGLPLEPVESYLKQRICALKRAAWEYAQTSA